MSSGRHSSDEEFEFDFESIRPIVIGIGILMIIAGVVLGTYKMVHKMKDSKTEQTSAESDVPQEEKYDVLGKIKIEKIGVEQSILDSVEDKALEEGVIKLYGDALNQERKFLHSRS